MALANPVGGLLFNVMPFLLEICPFICIYVKIFNFYQSPHSFLAELFKSNLDQGLQLSSNFVGIEQLAVFKQYCLHLLVKPKQSYFS